MRVSTNARSLAFDSQWRGSHKSQIYECLIIHKYLNFDFINHRRCWRDAPIIVNGSERGKKKDKTDKRLA